MSKEIATIARTREIMETYDLYPKKGFGQNFIIEPEIVRHIAEFSGIDETTTAVEIGPGIGALTEQLAKKAKQVLCYEIDLKLQDVLKDTLAEYDNVKIMFEDVLKRNIKEDLKEIGAEKTAICANLPYYVTTPILFHLIESETDFESITVMVQKEMADRFNARVNTKEYNGLSVLLQYLYDIKIVMKVPKTVFIPKPQVDSIVIRFVPKKDYPIQDLNRFNEFVKGCFTQRRKTLYNNLKEFFNDKEKAIQVLNACNIDENRRAESLSVEDFVKLYEVTYEG
ncbi:MAG: 16S rRNA (adenine(1518)-N(6)/adenine(1519)-N(6))-dimethyltransferase RsmA [Erysipelotrichaceae bacterium]|nr:16S rRNA (adenine(1518)-N(6)/adenine(1519)-N(6))-dimethyltransferase RsmA [Erysipelotrichaceae bacterium]